MANIVLTNMCNLRCPYCFASDIVEENIKHINLRIFNEILDFILKENHEEKIGLIGGEPLLHPQFTQIIDILEKRIDLSTVTLFTNGIFLDKHIYLLKSKPVIVLVNYNSVHTMGIENRRKFNDNISFLSELKDRVSIGITLYNPEENYNDIIPFMKKNKLLYLRISIAAPNKKMDNGFNVLHFYWKMKQNAFGIIREALKVGLVPVFDCNAIPICLLKNVERKELIELFLPQKPTNVICIQNKCSPVIDIMQDKTAVRCFGCFRSRKVNIDEFNNIAKVREHFINTIDNKAKEVFISAQCKSCKHFERGLCFGGCLGFKIDNL